MYSISYYQAIVIIIICKIYSNLGNIDFVYMNQGYLCVPVQMLHYVCPE
jgi:hypothetical protein